MIRYAITDGLACATFADVDVVQLRAKTVDAGELAVRARALLRAMEGSGARLLVNGRADVAAAVGAAGVHLTSAPDELTVAQARAVFGAREAVVSVACHSVEEVARAAQAGADWMVFAPVFEKRVDGERVREGVGLEELQKACAAAPGRVLALGGVTEEKVADCLRQGAAGVAGIRMFEGDLRG